MQKKILYFFIALFFTSFSVKGQRHEIGVQLGMSNLVGDIGRTNYILQKPLGNYRELGIPFYGGIVYRRNISPYQSLRLNIGYSHIQFSDAHAKEFYRRNRYLEGSNSIYEADVLFEYNFFQVNEEQKSLLSPYIFGGVGGMLYNTPQLVIKENQVNDAEYVTAVTLAVPFGAGLKYKFNYNWALFGELMFRPTFSDSIDYSTVEDKNIITTKNTLTDQQVAEIIRDRQIGNPNSKDWVNSITLGLSYSFGRPPCFCD
ncbi:hypothetical protein EGI11_10525 [Chryseobacterium sp. H3056]|uniref:DUF6089 domain-containing protein n=1 Tax=Kaistella daneshvariae TaxID=2487074 RepID=A0A3N0WTM4_9FLAO|nr:DUF6089 family protein [Kaistella daneshvariae]ROI08081.1 hypothetical protein EGI11_10525 [Kaistella daneshvariae]